MKRNSHIYVLRYALASITARLTLLLCMHLFLVKKEIISLILLVHI